MSISYFSLTANGSLLALKLRDRFGGTAHLPRCHSLGCSRCSPFDDLAEAMPDRFRAGDTLVCVMAAGIVFRMLAPCLRSKQEDPAVIVIDEAGRYVIPLLGGHAAGANSLSREIAGFLEAEAVLTTASDVQGLVAPDQVAALLGTAVADREELKKVTALLVDGKPVCIESSRDPGLDDYQWVPPGSDLSGYSGRILVNHVKAGEDAVLPTARLVPPVITAGVGCKRGTDAEMIVKAVTDACQELGIDPLAVGSIATVDAKKDEAGLVEAAALIGATLVFFTADELATLGRPGSSFVEDQVGTRAVCEPAALLAAGEGAYLLSGKTANGPVTVALSYGPGGTPVDAEGPPEGEVMVVGTGAGTASLLTEEARQALRAADVVIGYRTYIDQVRLIFPDKRYISGAMGKEVERCREALQLARAGQAVAMVSSGDPGVYGMAGLLMELADGARISVVPGVTAAQLAAARLGAPLMNDFITLSLSDLLTPRDEVLRRAEAAAASDMVICLYNPSSRNRRPLFEDVCGLLTRHRPPDTLVGWVKDAGGPGEASAIITLAELSSQDIDMRCIVIVGNSKTSLIEGRMVTRRGYE